MQMIREHFTWFSKFFSLVATIRIYYRYLKCHNPTVEEGIQVTIVTRAHHATCADLMQPFEACITEGP